MHFWANIVQSRTFLSTTYLRGDYHTGTGLPLKGTTNRATCQKEVQSVPPYFESTKSELWRLRYAVLSKFHGDVEFVA